MFKVGDVVTDGESVIRITSDQMNKTEIRGVLINGGVISCQHQFPTTYSVKENHPYRNVLDDDNYTFGQLQEHGQLILEYLGGAEIEVLAGKEWISQDDPEFNIDEEYRVYEWKPELFEDVVCPGGFIRKFVFTDNRGFHFVLPEDVQGNLNRTDALFLRLLKFNKIKEYDG